MGANCKDKIKDKKKSRRWKDSVLKTKLTSLPPEPLLSPPLKRLSTSSTSTAMVKSTDKKSSSSPPRVSVSPTTPTPPNVKPRSTSSSPPSMPMVMARSRSLSGSTSSAASLTPSLSRASNPSERHKRYSQVNLIVLGARCLCEIELSSLRNAENVTRQNCNLRVSPS